MGQRRARRQRDFAGRPRPQQSHRPVCPALYRTGWRRGYGRWPGLPRRKRSSSKPCGTLVRRNPAPANQWKKIPEMTTMTKPNRKIKIRCSARARGNVRYCAARPADARWKLICRMTTRTPKNLSVLRPKANSSPTSRSTASNSYYAPAAAAVSVIAISPLPGARRRDLRSWGDAGRRKANFLLELRIVAESRPRRLSERGQVHVAHGHFARASESRAVSVHHA